MKSKRVVITGIGIVSPLGNNREDTWKGIINGISAADYIKQFDASSWPVKFSCEVKNFNISENAFCKEDAIFLNRTHTFGLQSALESMQDSGLINYEYEQDKIGISIGTNIGALKPLSIANLLPTLSEKVQQNLTSNGIIDEKIIFRNHPSSLSIMLAKRWGIRGPIYTIQTACSSSAQAIGQAFLSIKRNEADIMLCGGSDSLLSELLLAGFCLIGTLSKRNDDPSRGSRPFDKDRDGFVVGEGASMLILEDLDHALQRSAKIYAEIVGYGETESAYRITDLPEDGRGIKEAMLDCISQSNLKLSQINYINAHGTSTILNDMIEAKVIEDIFSKQNYFPAVSSTKSEIGHLISAAGAIELAFCALSIRDGIIPPSINLDNTDCGKNINLVANHAQTQKVYAAMSNSIGFGGSNSCIIIKQYEY